MDPSAGGVSNGYYGDNSGGSGGSDSVQQQQPKDDFEDYMWMANEEEAEKEMLQQIKDEQCFDEMIEEEERNYDANASDLANMWQTGQTGWSSGCQEQPQPQQTWSTGPPAVPPEDALANNIQTLSVNDKPKVELNPMAAEFVPGQAFQPASG